MSDPEIPDPAPEAAPTPEPPPPPPPTPEPAWRAEPPVLASMPGWVPAAVVAGAVLLVEGLIVSRIRPESSEGGTTFVADLATVSFALGALGLLAGYAAYLLARTSLPRALEAIVLSAVAVASYGWAWRVLLAALGGDAATLPGVEELGLSGKFAAVGAIVWMVIAALLAAVSFYWLARIVWPYFRSGVALNVVAMLHIVVFLLGGVSYLNLRFVPRMLGSGIDLTETGQFSLSDKTRAVLGKVEGELLVFLVDYGEARRSRSPVTTRVRDLLQQYQAACPKMVFRPMDALRSGDEIRKALMDAGMERLIEGLTGEEDAVLIGYRPAGEKLVARTKVVPVNQEFADTSALGNARFKGEGILTNALNEVVFVQRKAYFLEGHGERPTAPSGSPVQSVSLLADALRSDNFAVSPLSLVKEPSVPGDADLVAVVGPKAPVNGAEVEALRAYLLKGGAVLLFLDVPATVESTTGLEGFLDSWGVAPRRDTVVVSWLVESTLTKGDLPSTTADVYASRDEFGRHPSMEALRGSSFVVSFKTALPVFRADRVPEGVDVQELVFAPREIRGWKPFAALLSHAQKSFQEGPQPGDIVDRRLPVAIAAERKAGETARGGGRLVVFGDSDFVTDKRIDPADPAATPANRTLALNAASWAVRRDLVAIDPKTVETEMVQLRPVDRDLAFWATVVALPVIALGVAVGVWWSRRR